MSGRGSVRERENGRDSRAGYPFGNALFPPKRHDRLGRQLDGEGTAVEGCPVEGSRRHRVGVDVGKGDVGPPAFFRR